MFLLFFTVDQIYHLASPASPPNYMYNPIKTLKTNTIGTLNMLGEYVRVHIVGLVQDQFRNPQLTANKLVVQEIL